MNNLDDTEAMKVIDRVNVRGSIEQLGEQSRQAWDEVHAMTFPDAYKAAKSIVFSGMGGSALGAYVNKALFWDTLAIPFEIVNDYHLPAYTKGETLVILSTYSGTTEETLACGVEAVAKKSMVTGVTTGAKLGEFMKANALPAYIFVPKFNPSNQPRLGSGYSVVGLSAMLDVLGYVHVDAKDIEEIVAVLAKGNSVYGVDIPEKSNKAKLLARAWVQKIPVIVAARHLMQVGRVLRNQIHESAKSFAAYHDVPELNHHLLEGLTNPATNKEMLRFLFLDSVLYEDKIKKRMDITKVVIEKQGIAVERFAATAQSRIAQAMECIQFGAYVNYYMAMLSDLDPSKIPWVDYFKAELAKS